MEKDDCAANPYQALNILSQKLARVQQRVLWLGCL